jgi:hypothetical protein
MSRSITSSDANGVTFETVGSTGGFSAGDLIYYGTTGYNKIPSSASPTTASSTLTKNFPALPTTVPTNPSGGVSSGYFNPTNFAGIGFNKSVALLYSGNAVAVYGNPVDGYPYFVVYNPTTRAIVVGPTVISTTFVLGAAAQTGGYNIGVVADVVQGKFLVYWGNSTGGVAQRVNFAIYGDGGGVVLAPVQDATLAVNNVIGGCMRAAWVWNPLAGNFVIAFGNGNNVYFRVYDTAGVGSFAWVTLAGFSNAAGTGSNPSWGLTGRGNEYLLVGQSTTATLYNYAVYNQAGTALVATTTFPVTNGFTNGVIDCTSQTGVSSSENIIIAYAGTTSATGTQGWSFRTLAPSTYTLTSPQFVQGNFNSSSGNASPNYLRVWPFATSFFLITGVDSNGDGAYAIFDYATGVPTLGTTGSLGTASNTRSFGSYYQTTSPVLGVLYLGSSAELYLGTRAGVNTSNSTYIKINLSSYNLTSSITTSGALTIPLGTISTTAYVGTNSTPSKASFALSNGIYPYAPKLSTVAAVTASGVYPIITSTGLTTIASFDFCVLSNGNICAVTVQTSGSVLAYIYNPTTLAVINVGDLTPVTGASFHVAATVSSSVRVAPLDSGSFCIAVGTTATNLRLTAFTSSFVQQGSTVNITTFTQSFTSSGQNFSLAGISGNRFVVVYQTSTLSASFAVYTSAVVLSVGPTVVATDAAALSSNIVCAIPNGFIVGLNLNTANTFNFYNYIEYSAGVFAQPTFATGSLAATAGTAVSKFFATCQNGQTYLTILAGTTITLYSIYGITISSILTRATTATNNGAIAAGITAAGNPFILYQDTSAFTTGVSVINMTVVPSITGWTSPSTRATTSQIKSMPMYGNMVLVGYVSDASNTLVFGTMLVNGAPDSAVFTTSDATNGSPIYPLATTTVTPSIANFTFAGVAVTDCTAGGTGVIQTTGATNLNSTYPTTTAQTFDYTGQVAPGLKGTISGRSISMRKS